MALDHIEISHSETAHNAPRSWHWSTHSSSPAADDRAGRVENMGTPNTDVTLALRLAPKFVVTWLLVVVLILLAAGIAACYLQLGVESHYEYSDTFIELFNLDLENNVPTWFSSSLLLANAALLALIAFATFRLSDRWRWHWCGLAVVFVFLSLDEAAMLHERAVFLREIFNLSGLLYFAWIIPAMLCLAIFACIYLRFTLALPPKTLMYFGAAALLYVGGALGMEMIAGDHVSQFGRGNLLYGMMVIGEECLEMLGQVVFFYALANYAVSRWESIVIDFGA